MGETMAVQAIIFDLYGVLAMNGWQAFKAAHFSDRENVWHHIYLLSRQVDAGLAGYDDLVRFTAEQSGESEATVRYQMEHSEPNIELLEYIAAELKGRYKLSILSNSRSDDALNKLFTPEQRALFDDTLLSHHLGLFKPDPRMYLAAAERLGVAPEACLFVDDREHHAAGAQQAGMRPLIYTNLTKLEHDLAALL